MKMLNGLEAFYTSDEYEEIYMQITLKKLF